MRLQEIIEFIHVALTALRLNKLRSALTALGIIIGVASVIVMAAIGNGATAQLQQQIAMLGTNVINVMAGSMRIGGRQLGFGGAAPLSEKDMRALREAVPEVMPIEYGCHRDALRIAVRYKLSFYDSLMIAVALANGATILYSEDMQHGMIIDDSLTIINPFLNADQP